MGCVNIWAHPPYKQIIMNKIEVEQFLEDLTLRLIQKPTVKTWQACRWKIRNQQLTFEVHGLLFKGTVEIELNDSQDAYNIYLCRMCSLEKFIPNVDGKHLVQVLDTHLENPKDGSYFERIKEYANSNKC